MRKFMVVINTVVIALTAVSFAAETPGQLTQAQRAEIEKELTAATRLLVEDIKQLSSAKFAKLISADFQERVAGGNITPAQSGKEAYVKWMNTLSSQRISQKFEVDLIRVNAVTTDVA